VKLIWQDMYEHLKEHQDFVLVTIISSHGSSPRSAGAHMMILSDQNIIGTIGGGLLEAEAMKHAETIFKTKQSELFPYTLTGKEAANTQMICGGEGELLLDYYDGQNQEQFEIIHALFHHLETGEKSWLITRIGDDGKRQQCLIDQYHNVTGHFECDPHLYEKMIQGPSKFAIHSETLAQERIIIDPIHHLTPLYIFGAGHVSHKIAPIAESVGFSTTIIDDRATFANKERFPHANIIVMPSLNDSLKELNIPKNSFIIIVTRGHLHDAVILEQLLSEPFAYIGMIGSRHKRDTLYQQLIDKGQFSKDDLKRVYSPIGLPILAETPEEIAVSIVAEIIKVRAEQLHDKA